MLFAWKGVRCNRSAESQLLSLHCSVSTPFGNFTPTSYSAHTFVPAVLGYNLPPYAGTEGAQEVPWHIHRIMRCFSSAVLVPHKQIVRNVVGCAFINATIGASPEQGPLFDSFEASLHSHLQQLCMVNPCRQKAHLMAHHCRCDRQSDKYMQHSLSSFRYGDRPLGQVTHVTYVSPCGLGLLSN
jgi:hypothetical protein